MSDNLNAVIEKKHDDGKNVKRIRRHDDPADDPPDLSLGKDQMGI